ncbi:MAG: hypothetical protein L6R37_008021 [Teloschistes peruensis]|nr:MAG: hypothetical protein L6R37_008021 [Teloschistes peruensis]
MKSINPIECIIPNPSPEYISEIFLLKCVAHGSADATNTEIPCGNFSASDTTILDANSVDAIKRALIEQTGLRTVDIIGSVLCFGCNTKAEDRTADGSVTRVWRVPQLKFICEVALEEFGPDPEMRCVVRVAIRYAEMLEEMTE